MRAPSDCHRELRNVVTMEWTREGDELVQYDADGPHIGAAVVTCSGSEDHATTQLQTPGCVLLVSECAAVSNASDQGLEQPQKQ